MIPTGARRLNAVAHWAAAFVVSGVLACAGGPGTPAAAPQPDRMPERSADAPETDCAWYGDGDRRELWFGVSSFWSAMRRNGGNPAADLEVPGGVFVGRFETATGHVRFEYLADGPSGVWDVLLHPNGRTYATTFFDVAWVRQSNGVWERLGPETIGLNELAPGPGGRILASRYGGDGGSVVVMGETGRIQAEFPLETPAGTFAAAKSLAWDPVRAEIWVNTDLLGPEDADSEGEAAHDTRILTAGGRERLRFARPEVQFMTFGADGTGYFAEVDSGRLRLRIRPPDAAGSVLGTGRWIGLDDAFAGNADFVQDLRVAADGTAVLTRWSGRVHVVDRAGRVRDLDFPSADGDLYYTGDVFGDKVCATVCRTRAEPSPATWVRCLDLPD